MRDSLSLSPEGVDIYKRHLFPGFASFSFPDAVDRQTNAGAVRFTTTELAEIVKDQEQKTPFNTKELLAAGFEAMRRTICEQEPPRPSTRLRALVAAREADAVEFYDALAPAGTTPEAMQILRQACAGLVWSKQMYPYNVRRWLEGDPAMPPPPASGTCEASVCPGASACESTAGRGPWNGTMVGAATNNDVGGSLKPRS
jgi:hypothetical protein